MPWLCHDIDSPVAHFNLGFFLAFHDNFFVGYRFTVHFDVGKYLHPHGIGSRRLELSISLSCRIVYKCVCMPNSHLIRLLAASK